MPAAKKGNRRGGGVGDGLPDVRGAAPVAVVSADWHLTDKVPGSRSCLTKDEWYSEMADRVLEMVGVANELKVPMVVAGDVFHTWREPVALVDRVMDWLSVCDEQVYMIPGQHDLPYHRLDLIQDSPLWLLNRLPNVAVYNTLAEVPLAENWRMTAAPWGQWRELKNWEVDFSADCRRLLVAHRFAYVKEPFPGADPAGQMRSKDMEDRLAGYSAALFGDNHTPFACKVVGTVVWNNGCVLRHKKSERQDATRYGVLQSDGKFSAKFFAGCFSERWVDGEVEYVGPVAAGTDLSAVVEKVNAMAKDVGVVDFKSAVLRLISTGRLSKLACAELIRCLPDD